MNNRKNLIRRMIGVALAVLMVVSMFAAVPFTASAETNETVYIDANATNADVSWNSFHTYGEYWSLSANPIHVNSIDEDWSIGFASRDICAAGTYTLAEIDVTFRYRRYHSAGTNVLLSDVFFTDGSFTITVDGYVVTLSGTFTGDDGKTYVVTVTNSDGSGETIEISLYADNAAVVLNEDEWGNDYISAENDDYSITLEIQGYSAQTPGINIYSGNSISVSVCDRHTYGQPTINLFTDSCTVNVDEDLVTTVCGTFLGSNGKTYVLTITNGSCLPEKEYTLFLGNIGSVPEDSVWRSYFPEWYSGDADAMYSISIQMPYGTILTLPTASEMTVNGYSFRGWFTYSQLDDVFAINAITFDFTKDETLYAKWTPNTYTVTVDPNGGYRNLHTSAGAAYRSYKPYSLSIFYGAWMRLFGYEGPIRRDGYRLVGFTGVNGGPVAGSFVEPSPNSSTFNDPNEYYYYFGPTDETLVAQWERIPDEISVTIGDQIGVNLMLNLDARDAETVTVTYKDLNGDEQTETFTDFSSLPRTDEGLYKIKVQIAPAQIADTVTVYIDGETLDASVKDYCSALTDGGYGEEVAALAQAVLDYGQAANNYFNYTDEAMSTLANLTADDAKAWEKQLSDTTGKLRAMSFMALTKPEFRFYMKDITETQAAAYNAAGVTAAYTNSDITDTLHARFVKNAQGSILIEVTGVQAEYMSKTIVVTVPGLGTITFAGNDFAKMMADNAATETLGAALYAYGEAARICFANA